MGVERWRGVGSRRPRLADLLLSLCLMALAALLGWLSYTGLRQPDLQSGGVSASPTSAVPAPPDLSEAAGYVDQHFGGAEWYPSIEGYEPAGSGGIAVLTSLSRNEGEEAVAICRAVSFWRPGDDFLVVVRASDGTPLAESPRGSKAAECRARDKGGE